MTQCCGLLALDEATVDVVIRDAPARVVPEVGVGGFNPDAHTIFVNLDPGHQLFDSALDQSLVRTIAHELHHLARRRGPGYGRTLHAALVSEGLAVHFSVETTGGGGLPAWATALTEAEIEVIAERASRNYLSPNYDHRAWFYGSSSNELPRWAGYALGFRLVGRYLAATPDASAASLVHAPAELIVPTGTDDRD